MGIFLKQYEFVWFLVALTSPSHLRSTSDLGAYITGSTDVYCGVRDAGAWDYVLDSWPQA